MTGKNLARDRICKGIRVSTAELRLSSAQHEYTQLETWVFSDLPQQRSFQVIHRTTAGAIKAHRHIVENMKRIHSPTAPASADP